MAFANRKDQGLSSGAALTLIISTIQSKVIIEQPMVGALGGNKVFTVPTGSVFGSFITIYVGGGELEILSSPADYVANSATQFTLTNAPSTQPYCSYVSQ